LLLEQISETKRQFVIEPSLPQEAIKSYEWKATLQVPEPEAASRVSGISEAAILIKLAGCTAPTEKTEHWWYTPKAQLSISTDSITIISAI
jgi:hypothetical protein